MEQIQPIRPNPIYRHSWAANLTNPWSNLDNSYPERQRERVMAITKQTTNISIADIQNMRDFLTIVRGYSDRTTPEPILLASSQMARHINNLVNIQKHDSQQLKMSVNNSTFSDLYRPIQSEIQSIAKTNNQIVLLNIPNNLPDIAADTTYISEVLYNIISNALKFSNSGGIISIEANHTTDHINILVTDHGVGMNETTIGSIFAKPGTSLYISQIIVRLHGGTISVHSEHGTGSKFTISLPAHKRAADKLISAAQPNIIHEGHGWIKQHLLNNPAKSIIKKILYIDSNPIIANMYYNALKTISHTTTLEHSGTDGLATARTGQYDLIVIDLDLIGHSGVEMINSLISGKTNLIPKSEMIILTNQDPDQSSRELLQNHASAYLIKSETTPEKLVSIIKKL